MVAVVDEDRCSGCGICLDACPEGALSLDGIVVVATRRCTGCGTCIVECPNDALSLGQQTPALGQGVAG